MSSTSYKIAFILLLVLSVVFFACRSPKIKHTTLFEGTKAYPWKVVYVNEDYFPAGKTHYYEVYYGKQQLLLPKEIFGSVADISAFTAASGFEIQDNNSNAVLLTIEHISKNAEGANKHQFISFFVAKINDGQPNTTFWVLNLDRQKIAEFQL